MSNTECSIQVLNDSLVGKKKKRKRKKRKACKKITDPVTSTPDQTCPDTDAALPIPPLSYSIISLSDTVNTSMSANTSIAENTSVAVDTPIVENTSLAVDTPIVENTLVAADAPIAENTDQRSPADDDPYDIVLLSDTESNSSLEIIEEDRNVELVDLDDELEDGDNDDSVIVISGSRDVNVKSTDHFKLDTAPDFIPIGNRISGGQKRRAKPTPRTKRVKLSEAPNQAHPRIHKSRLSRIGPPAPCERPNLRYPTIFPSIPHDFRGLWPPAIPPSAPNMMPCPWLPGPSLPVSTESHEQRARNHQTPLIQLSYPNILNDNTESTEKKGLRPIVIDGSNVGCGYGNGEFVMRGPILVVQYFKNRGHDEIVCFLPQFLRHRTRSKSEERTVSILEKEDVISCTPSRKLDNGNQYIPYDDRYIVQYATERQGVIISNDGYRDLINEEASWRETIEKRIVNYTFARGIFMLPKDPFGRGGPTLDEVLKFPSE